MKIVTAGKPYIDLDAYASCIAYTHLLNLQNQPSCAVCTATINESVTPSLRNLNTKIDTEYNSNSDDTFIILDLSDPNFFDSIVDHSKIEEVIDHHPGFEAYWQEKLGTKCHIEEIGSVTTLIFEKYEKANLVSKLPHDIGLLLATAIAENTLNFKAKITKPRDLAAYQTLAQNYNLSPTLVADYFKEIQTSLEQNFAQALQNDTKDLDFGSLGTCRVGQLTIWDSKQTITTNHIEIEKILSKKQTPWFLNAIDIRLGQSFFYTTNLSMQQFLEKLYTVNFVDNTASLPHMLLRKEILKAAQKI